MEKKIIYSLIMAFALTCVTPAAVSAQDYVSAPVTVSKDKVRVNGKICWSHIVREKQTLFSIAKAYEVTVDDIYAFNPTLKETGLKKNSIIIIPSKEALQEKPAAETEQTKPESSVQHKESDQPEQKQTETSVRQKPEDHTEKIVKPETAERSESEKKHKTHTVKWYEDLDVIAEKYGVTVEAIMKANNLSGRKLSKRQKLIIPQPGEFMESDTTATEPETETPDQKIESETEPTDSTELTLPEADQDWFFKPKDEVKATLILPMKASTGNVSRNNMDFYSGVLLAVKDLADSGVSTELNVYDSSDSNNPIVSEDLDNSDLLIGPVSSGDLGRLLG